MIKSGIKKMGLFIAFGAILGGVSAQNSTGDTKEVQSEYAGFKTFRFGGFPEYRMDRYGRTGIRFLFPVLYWLLTISSIRNGYSVLRSNLKPVVQVWR